MDRSSLGNRCAPARRSRQLVAGALCTASFAVGQLLFGQEPAPQFIFNPFAQPASAVRPADERAIETPRPLPPPPREIAAAAEAVSPNKLRPAAITAVENDDLAAQPLAPIVGSTEAAPRKRPAKKAEPLLIQNTAYADEAIAPAARRVEARPLPLDSAASGAAEAEAEGAPLAPIVPASAMPRRPAKREAPAGSTPATAPSVQRPAGRLQARPAWMEDIRQSLSPLRRTSQAR